MDALKRHTWTWSLIHVGFKLRNLRSPALHCYNPSNRQLKLQSACSGTHKTKTKQNTAQQACNRNDMLMHGPPARDGHARSHLCLVGVRVHDPPGREQCTNGICHEAKMLTVTEQRIAVQTLKQRARHKKSNAPINIAWHTSDGQ